MNKVYASEVELSGLLEKYDHNQDGKITLAEFVDELRPALY
jgi:Ca2+-binding EF-hand superfamily protein